MKFLIVLFALAAVAFSKPHGGQPQTFQVQVQPSQQQAAPQPVSLIKACQRLVLKEFFFVKFTSKLLE